MSPIGTAMPEIEQKPRKRMGRPPKAPEKGRRQNYTFRMSDETRDRVIAAAAASGRSMSEELEWRVEESFREEDRRLTSSALMNGSRNAYSLISKIIAAINYLENLKDKSGNKIGSLDWHNHEQTSAGIRAAIDSLVMSATSPVHLIDHEERKRSMDQALKRIGPDNKLSKSDQELLMEKHDELMIGHMEMHGRIIAGVLSGSISLDKLSETLAPRD